MAVMNFLLVVMLILLLYPFPSQTDMIKEETFAPASKGFSPAEKLMYVGRLCGSDSVEKRNILKALEAEEWRRKGGGEQLTILNNNNNNPVYF